VRGVGLQGAVMVMVVEEKVEVVVGGARVRGEA